MLDVILLIGGLMVTVATATAKYRKFFFVINFRKKICFVCHRKIILVRCYLFVTASDLPRCRAGDTVCLPKVITEILQNYPNGHNGLKMPQIEPLHINKLEIQQSRNSPVAVNITFNQLDMYGSSSTNVLRVV